MEVLPDLHMFAGPTLHFYSPSKPEMHILFIPYYFWSFREQILKEHILMRGSGSYPQAGTEVDGQADLRSRASQQHCKAVL